MRYKALKRRMSNNITWANAGGPRRSAIRTCSAHASLGSVVDVSSHTQLAEPAVAKSTLTNSFGIHLTIEPVDGRITAYAKGDWSNIRLAEFPVISDADILTYDFTNHLMMLEPEALKRLPRPNASGTPFVVLANGERVYWGIFMTLSSSISRAIPSIVIDEHMLDTNLPPNTLRISRVYAAPYSKDDPDPRSDDRTRRTLSALHKLK